MRRKVARDVVSENHREVCDMHQDTGETEV